MDRPVDGRTSLRGLPRDVGLAALLAAVVVAGTAGQMAQDRAPDVGVVGWSLLAVALLACVVRRLVPLVTLLVTAGAASAYLSTGLPYGPVLFPVAVGAWSAARHARPRPALVTAAVAVLVVWAHLLWQTPTSPGGEQRLDGFLVLLPSAAFVIVPFAAGYALRVRAEAAVRARAHALSEQVAAERLRLSQDVHDVVGHGLAAIKMQADVALHVAGSGSADGSRPALEAISATAGTALQELRDVLGRLRVEGQGPGDERAPHRGLADLPGLVDRVEQAGVPVTHRVEGTPGDLPPATELALYRVLQESLTNVLRHGDGGGASVVVTHAADEVVVEVSNRPGPPTVSVGGAGLDGMRMRVEAAGGTVDAGRRGAVFVVTARVPTAEGDEEQP